MARIRGYIAASIDGFIADADGGVGWLDDFSGHDYGYERFLAQIRTVVLGRTTYEQVLGFGAWPYPEKRGWVVTSRPLADPPPGVAAWTEGARALIDRLRNEEGDAWVVGGAKLQAAFIEAGGLDRLELFVMPRILGAGVRLFPPMAAPRAAALVGVEALGGGVARLEYTFEPIR